MKQNNPLRLLVILSLAAIALTANAKLDKKYYDKVAKEVWAEELPMFNPKADLSDSLYQNRSAVIIGHYIGLKAAHDKEDNTAKYSATGIRASNTIDAIVMVREMVKLNDASAIEYFSEFTLPPAERNQIRGYTIMESRPAFGARIHKPDGSIKEVDVQEALAVKTGKKSKNEKEYKLAVSGLEVGDILEYFIYQHFSVDELHLPRRQYSVMNRYPTKHYLLDCQIAPTLAFEYGTYNGLPSFNVQSPTPEGLNHATIELEDVEPIEDDIDYFSAARQTPYVIIHVLNNTARLEMISNASRIGGMRKMIYPFLLQDIAANILATKYPEKAVSVAQSIYRDWASTHPDATERERSDAAWMSLRYGASRESLRMDDRMQCVAFSKLLEKIKHPVPGRVAVTSSRKDVPVTELASARDAKYIAKVGDTYYFPMAGNMLAPGEIPANYCGEKVILYNGSPDNKRLHMAAEIAVLPQSRPKENHIECVHTVKLNPENEENLLVDTKMNINGYLKSLVPIAITSIDAWKDSYAKYLGTKPGKADDDKSQDAEELMKKLADKTAQSMWGSEEVKLNHYELLSQGGLPGADTLRFKLDGEIPTVVSGAGNGLIVNIGKLIGDQKTYKGSERKRDIAVVTDGASRYTTRIIFNIPDGYEATQESVANLARKVLTPEGAFVVEAKIEGNQVLVNISERYSRAIYPAESWENLLQIFDGCDEFRSANIVLKSV